MKQLPQNISVRIFADNHPINGMFIRVTVKVGRKNNFDLGFGPSNSDGRITINQNDIIYEAEKERKFFIMDYGDPVKDFLGEIEITPFNKKALNEAIVAYNMFEEYFTYPEGYLANLRRAIQIIDNKNIKTLTVEIIHNGKNIVVMGRTTPCE